MKIQVNRRSVLAALVASLCFFRANGQNSRQREDEPRQSYRLRKFIAPFYGSMARQVALEGKATLVAHIGKDGKVNAVSEVSRHPLFHEAVSDAVKEWQFDSLNDQPGQIEITFKFSLKGDRDWRVLNYKVSGTLPNYFEIEVNPVPDNLQLNNERPSY